MSLRVLEVHTTLTCNIACGFCGLRTLEKTGDIEELSGALRGDGPARERLDARRAWSVKRHVAESLVPLPALLDAVRAAADLGCGLLTVSGGGEPLAAPERTFAVLAAGRAAGMRTRLVTNGTLLAAHAIRLADLDVLTISVLGPDHASHDDAAGATGSYARLLDGLGRLPVPGPRREVHTPLTACVRARLSEMADAVVALGASTWWVLPLKGEPVPELAEEAVAYASKLKLRHNLAHERGRPSLGCAAADGQLVIHADGTITPCCSMRWGSGDLLDRDLSKVWVGPWLASVRDALRAGRRAPSCADCADPSRELRET